MNHVNPQRRKIEKWTAKKWLQNPIVFGMETIASNKLNFNEQMYIYILCIKKRKKKTQTM